MFVYFLLIFLALGLVPIFDSILKSVKAFFNGRKTLRIFQTYFDLIKLFQKETSQSQYTSFFSFIWPVIMLVNVLVFFCFIPIINPYFDINIIYLFYILSLGNFFLILYAMDNATYFAGLWVEREMFVLSIVESVLILMIVLFVMIWWTSNLSWLHNVFASAIYSPFQVLFYIILIGVFFYIILAENKRFPFDNPSTHLELTMIHEAMLLETQWKQLALLEIIAKIKMFAFLSLFIFLFFPFDFWITNTVILFWLWIAKMIGIIIFIGFWEMIITKMRLFRYQEIFVTLLVSQILLIFFYILK